VLGLEESFAKFALVLASAHVYSQVLCQISLLCETLITTRLVTNERALACVHTEMVKEVVPLSEEHTTIRMVAF
jgi:hypothetical protein